MTNTQKIFKDRSKLSPRYIPTKLYHREKQINILSNIFEDLEKNPDSFPLTPVQIIGSTGIGKTSTIIKFTQLLEEKLSTNKLQVKIIYINLKLQGGNKYAIYKFLLSQVSPELPSQGLSAEEMLRQMINYLNENSIYTFIILDEIDYLIKIAKDADIIYDLTRLNEFNPNNRCNVKGVIFIARSTDFYEKLDQAEISSLGRIPIEFQNYTLDQISDILSKRCDEAFERRVISTDIIDLISKIIDSPIINGDLRYALDLLSYSGNRAENEGTEKIFLEQVQSVHNKMNVGFSYENIKNLSKLEIFMLISILRGIKAKKNQYVEFKEIKLQFIEILKKYNIKKKSEVEDLLNSLDEKGIVKIKSLKKIYLNTTSLIDLEKLLDKKIEKNLDTK
ncbi:MAG: Cdc6/Cdc18 family protein [Nitrososphaeraceae archaeon]